VSNRNASPEPTSPSNPDPEPQPGDDHTGQSRGRIDRAAKRAQLERDLKALTPEQKKQVVRVNRYVFGFGIGALAAMIGLNLPVPWPVLGLAALVVSAVVAVKGLILAHRTPLARGAVVYLAMGLGLLSLFALYSIPLIITWSDQLDYRDCLSQTQTIEGQDACRDQFQEATKADWTRILRQLSE
jgi:hypothetical protein